jgi:hypothetical protein
MATKKKSGGSIDRQIAAQRKKIAAVKAKARAEKAAKKKAATLKKLKNEYSRIAGTKSRSRRRR